MGDHIDAEGRFQSDKHPLPPDRIRLNFTNPASQRALYTLAEDYAEIDPELSDDIKARLTTLGYEPPTSPLDELLQQIDKLVMVCGLKANGDFVVALLVLPEAPEAIGIMMADVIRNWGRHFELHDGIDRNQAVLRIWNLLVAEMKKPTSDIRPVDIGGGSKA